MNGMLQKEQLKQVLAEQRAAFLKKDLGVGRAALSLVGEKIKLPHVVVISGLRRCGKSTLLRQIVRKFYQDLEFYYVSFEDERLFGFDASQFNDIYEAQVELFGKKKAFFIDEIQNVDRFESFVRRFYDSGFKFFISGSNARLLSKELGTKLTGRHVDIQVRPFSFQEFLALRKFNFDKAQLYKTEGRAAIKRLFSEFLARGGMPEYLVFGDPEVLSRVYDDIVIKDIAVRHGVLNVAQMRDLYKYLIANFSNKFSLNSLRKLLNFGSMNTVKAFVSYLEQAYFVSVVSKFDYSLKKQMVNDKKLYVADNAFIPLLFAKTTKDNGRMLENLAFNVLSEKANVFYFSNGNECDFVAIEKNILKMAVQVCWELTENNKDRELRGISSCMETLKIKHGMILTYDQEEELVFEGLKISIKPIWKWLLE
ncbi:ATP-binding protein [Candidatus Micrarchaeota archaeon]|nr:ATP-binding protein [Candidatus Micrarchaeota archaeon]